MTKLVGLLDPESAALVTDAVDAVTSPRRGGPRFVDPDAVSRADAIINDSRRTEQLALDALVDMVRIATAADRGRVFGVPCRPFACTSASPTSTAVPAPPTSKAKPPPFRSQPRTASAAPTDSCPSCSTRRVGRCNWAEASACSPSISAPRSPPSGEDAPTPAATDHPPGPKPTTSMNGHATTVPPTSRTGLVMNTPLKHVNPRGILVHVEDDAPDSQVMEDWRQFHSALIESYRDSKDGDELVSRIFAQYRSLDASDRSEINRLIDRDLAEADEQHRYDYLALIQEFRVTSASGGMGRLVDRLAGMPGPQALAEGENVIRLAQELGN